MKYHTTLTQEAWSKTSIVFQLANIGSEIERTISWKQKGNVEYSRKAFYRALELIYLSSSGPLTRPQQKEFTRMRELLVDWHMGTNKWHSTDAMWQKYFLAFAVASRNQHT